MEEKDSDKKLKKALEDIEKGLLFSEYDGKEVLKPAEFNNKESVFEQAKKNQDKS